ncbi:hypothetical protein GJ496_009732 [Pomphorhynchus laevis]|nr:hypothetical protein GJ496_009732 [Pomphorhynchus laevis]
MSMLDRNLKDIVDWPGLQYGNLNGFYRLMSLSRITELFQLDYAFLNTYRIHHDRMASCMSPSSTWK